MGNVSHKIVENHSVKKYDRNRQATDGNIIR